ncbi:MAG TPA: hypothetical protein VMM18_04510 [Gemmatimonadaceae bacterium]|nr:hypothetical protein [Gemmatimonadaceae bacterium]
MNASLSRLPLAAVLAACACAPLTLTRDDSATVLAQQAIAGPKPSDAGPYTVRTLYYGSGTDRRRPEFRDSVTIRTAAVDASPFVSLDPPVARSRNRYWGFEPKAFPVNGRVWYPDGPGPFPLVLIVHGNHDMRDFSDPGYDYLGELLASRGFILVSVDMNFLNGAIRNENDARGWMLLKHIEAWTRFDEAEDNPLRGKADLGNIALMGHSRGGEAVGHAAAFNRLSHYPDDAKVKFDFGYGIKSLVAIAPVDGQYRPASQLVPVENVNYLVFHGSHDGDVSTFHGLRQYQRVRFTDGQPWFKSAVYVYRANHGQWNTVWGNLDNGPRSPRHLELRGLIGAEEQREFARLYITAFLEATLKGERRWLPMFRDHRAIGAWLPPTMYFTRFEDHTFRAVADFEEDVDVTTGAAGGVTLSGDSLATWKETVVPFRWRTDNQFNNAVWLGWNNRIAGDDTTRLGDPASFTIALPDTLSAAWSLGRESSLVFLLAPTLDVPGPRQVPRDSAAADSAAKPPAARAPRRTPRAKEEPRHGTHIDLTVEMVDAAGNTARLPLSRYGAVRRPLDTRVYRRRGRDTRQFGQTYEIVLQSYVLPMADFTAADSLFDPSRVRAIRFVFDRTVAGTVIVDEIGFSRLDAGFLADR